MPSYKKIKIKQGDCVSSIAAANGLFPDSIWLDPQNQALRELRGDPNVLMPDDILHVHFKDLREETCATDQRHRFVRKGVPENLLIQFMLNDEPRAHAAYELQIDGKFMNGETDGDGVVEVSIPPGAPEGRILFRDPEEKFDLKLGEMDPVTELSGVQSRLLNMGFFNGAIDNRPSEALDNAIERFRTIMEIDATGELDDETRDRIAVEFGR